MMRFDNKLKIRLITCPRSVNKSNTTLLEFIKNAKDRNVLSDKLGYRLKQKKIAENKFYRIAYEILN